MAHENTGPQATRHATSPYVIPRCITSLCATSTYATSRHVTPHHATSRPSRFFTPPHTMSPYVTSSSCTGRYVCQGICIYGSHFILPFKMIRPASRNMPSHHDTTPCNVRSCLRALYRVHELSDFQRSKAQNYRTFMFPTINSGIVPLNLTHTCQT